jgi:hypothetical protein
MNKKIFSITCGGFLFLATFFYLHQKVQIYVEAYRLSNNYQIYNECVDKRDYLMYNFMKQVSVSKLNEWVERNEFSSVEKGRILALNLEKKNSPIHKNKLAFLFNRFLGFPTGSSTALAKDRE